jgi:hypothetical protein
MKRCLLSALLASLSVLPVMAAETPSDRQTDVRENGARLKVQHQTALAARFGVAIGAPASALSPTLPALGLRCCVVATWGCSR